MTKARTAAVLHRALDRAGLTDAAAAEQVTVRRDDDGRVHDYRYRLPCGTPGERMPLTSIPLRELGTSSAVCPDCDKQARWLGGDVATLLDAAETLAAARRYAADPARGDRAGKRPQLLRALDRQAAELDRIIARRRDDDPVAAAARQLTEVLPVVRAAVDRSGQDPQITAAVCDRIRDEMTLARWRGPLTFDATPTLVALANHRSPSARVVEVIDTFTVAGGPGRAVLICPRYAADYLHRYLESASRWTAALMTVPDIDPDDPRVAVAARLWLNAADGPLADLAAAWTAAGDVLDA